MSMNSSTHCQYIPAASDFGSSKLDNAWPNNSLGHGINQSRSDSDICNHPPREHLKLTGSEDRSEEQRKLEITSNLSNSIQQHATCRDRDLNKEQPPRYLAQEYGNQKITSVGLTQICSQTQNNRHSTKCRRRAYKHSTDVAKARDDNQKQMVCYGAIKSFDIVTTSKDQSSQPLVHWDGELSLDLTDGSSTKLSSRAAAILKALSEHAAIHFDLFLVKTNAVQLRRDAGNQRNSTTWSVTAVLCGPKRAMASVGDWLSSMCLWLQKPLQCSLDIPYCNPHKISNPFAPTVTTGQLSSSNSDAREACTDESRVNSILFTTRSYEGAPQPTLLKSRLHPHQCQALTFMQNRERGWDLRNDRHTNDLWQTKLDSFRRQKHFEALSELSSCKPPPEFCGGILADEMGLGKTCIVLALIAANLAQSRELLERPKTLIVVPLPLLQVWEKQIHEHYQPQAVKYITYHGPRKGLQESFDGYDIVLTTYESVSQEWRCAKGKKRSRGIISSLSWHRIVLDEAHKIKNKDADITKAVTALHADKRWCITGTPIQNRSSDLFALLRFLKVYPFDDAKMFDKVFVQPWKNADSSALFKLQQLMSTIAIRRPRTIIALPPKDESIVPVILSPDEQCIYDETKRGVAEVIDEAFDPDMISSTAYLNALQRINNLRYVCNHGRAPKRERNKACSSTSTITKSISHELSELFGNEYHDLSSLPEPVNQQPSGYQDMSLSVTPVPRSPSPLPVPLCSNQDDFTPGSEATSFVSSKVLAIVNELSQIPVTEKCVIFSFWTTTLDLLSENLTKHFIPHTRYDGSMSRFKRDQVLTSFASATALEIKVILVSISCGGQGLDLTAANNAFLVEPQWNPTLEEQAMSRVYRLGQTKVVKLRRFVTEGTLEQRIVDLQGRKRKLAELIVDRRGLDRSQGTEEEKGHKDHNSESSHKHEETRKLLWWLRDLVS